MAKRKKKKKHVVIRYPIWKDFTFKEVFSDPKITKRFLKSLLGVKLKKLIFLNAEEEIRPDGKGRNIRLDILAIDENGVIYNIEMQGSHLSVIPFRYRANGAAMDVKLIPKGIRTNDLKKIPKRYIIYICRDDPFDQGLRQYTIMNTIQETGIAVKDKTELICLNAKGTKGEVPVDIRAFLDYVESGVDDGTNAFVHAIHQKVIALNQNEKFLRYGMTLEQKFTEYYDDGDKNGEKRGLKKGEKKGERKGLKKAIRGVVEILREDGYSDDQILERITGKYSLTEKQAKKYL